MEKQAWRPRSLISGTDLLRRRRELGLSGSETYASIKNLRGKELLSSVPVQDLLAYTADWEPFIVNKNPKVTPDSNEARLHPETIDDLHNNSNTGEIELPYPFIVPSRKEGKASQWGNQQFYWDMYFINKALLGSGKKDYLQLAINHIENFHYLFDRLGYIPNASQTSLINRTQIPFLTGMITDIYKETGNKEWLREKMDVARREYENVWMYTEEEKIAKGIKRPSHRISNGSLLVRLAGTDVLREHYPAAAMGGEDDSAQWAKRAYEYAPVSLNSALYKYESDLAYASRELGQMNEAEKWQSRADKRKEEINDTFWDEKRGMYFDMKYNRKNGKWEKDLGYEALTTFMPLWVNLADQHQADKVVKNLHKFESPYGLFIATKKSIPNERLAKLRNRLAHGLSRRASRFIDALDDVFRPEQWNYPNIWAPMEYFAIDGMLNYSKKVEAKKTMENILKGMAAFYQERGTLPEKINGESGQNGGNYQYGDQEGFGWTSALAQLIPERLNTTQ